MAESTENQFETGTVVYDPASDSVGEYRGTVGPYALLRPVGGGREWEARPESLRPATPGERLSAGVRAANSRSSQHSPEPPAPVRDCAACADLAGLRDDARARHDGSAETDADVLLRRHQLRYHAPLLGLRESALVPDAPAGAEYETACTECPAGSGARRHPADVEAWRHGHTRETGHARYRRTVADYAVYESQVSVP
ncbi:hypothetical protein QF032_004537 [Streptomyces achromogenes]|uniref:DUF7848 domain-containing protein n=1 Tax=Streptomyces achromogenes TaxID=67255 RepID=A0ABU0Q4E3_STRAH|nr:hypothetical protein [Streptomyces achromogenes]MDQ0685538.1 hypothetical protein [Streptomyces achromogenes]MDQ0832693.1 hypothetical protein [Streptomyces achromogenes]